MNAPLTKHEGTMLVKLIVIGMVVQLMFVGYVFYSNYEERKGQAKASRAACERSRLDRVDNAKGWRAAQLARMNAVAEDLHISLEDVRKLVKRGSNLRDSADLVAAREYDKIASGQEARSRIACSVAFPKAGLFS